MDLKLYAETLGDQLIEKICDVPTVQVKMPADGRWPKWGRRRYKLRRIPILDVAATRGKNGIAIFVTNLSREEDFDVEISIREWETEAKKAVIHTIWNEDIRARKTLEETRVEIRRTEAEIVNHQLIGHFKRHSINVVTVEC